MQYHLRVLLVFFVLVGLWGFFPLLANAQQTPSVNNPIISTPTEIVLLPTITPSAPTPSAPATALFSAPFALSTPLAMAAPRTYQIGEGDTLLSVAVEVGVDINDMGCLLSPTFDFHQPLVIGMVLVVPPPEVLCHRVAAGETLQTIADFYQTDPAALLAEPWNEFSLNQSTLQPLLAGRYIRVPLVRLRCAIHDANCTPDGPSLPIPQSELGNNDFLPWMLTQQIGSSPLSILGQGGPAPRRTYDAVPANWPYGSGHFDWPISGWLTQGYRYDHRAIDVAANLGTPVAAADRGVVIRAGWNDQGYGMFVVIDHNIDYVTLYGHLSRVFVEEGDIVAKGQLIGAVGSTGNSTGPHLHFEIRDFGRLINPLELLGR